MITFPLLEHRHRVVTSELVVSLHDDEIAQELELLDARGHRRGRPQRAGRGRCFLPSRSSAASAPISFWTGHQVRFEERLVSSQQESTTARLRVFE